jgi:hypothetical protein
VDGVVKTAKDRLRGAEILDDAPTAGEKRLIRQTMGEVAAYKLAPGTILPPSDVQALPW